MTQRLRDWCLLLLCVLILYTAIACTVFAFRHPWATDTERLLWIRQALTWQAVPYDEMRPREVKP